MPSDVRIARDVMVGLACLTSPVPAFQGSGAAVQEPGTLEALKLKKRYRPLHIKLPQLPNSTLSSYSRSVLQQPVSPYQSTKFTNTPPTNLTFSHDGISRWTRFPGRRRLPAHSLCRGEGRRSRGLRLPRQARCQQGYVLLRPSWPSFALEAEGPGTINSIANVFRPC